MAGRRRKAALHGRVMQPGLADGRRPNVNGRAEEDGNGRHRTPCAAQEIRRPRRHRHRRAPRARRACRLAHAVDQHRQPLQYHLPQLLHRIEPRATIGSPTSRRAEAAAYFDEIEHGQWPVREIGFTGGEPFMNPHIIAMLGDALERGFQVLLLTNAMQPMQRPHISAGLLRLNADASAAPDASRQPRSLHEGAA